MSQSPITLFGSANASTSLGKRFTFGFRLTVALVGVTFLASTLSLAQGSSVRLRVPPEMLLWRPHIRYETTVHFSLVANGATVAEPGESGKRITLRDNRPLAYTADLRYWTEMIGEDGTPDQGEARRMYQKGNLHIEPFYEVHLENLSLKEASMTKGDFLLEKAKVGAKRLIKAGEALLGSEEARADRLEFLKRNPDGEVISVGLSSADIRVPSRDVDQNFGDFRPILEVTDDLRYKAYILSWRTADQTQKGNLEVLPDVANGGKEAPLGIREMISQEASLLFNSVRGGRKHRSDECWTIDGSTLSGLIYPTLPSKFTGAVVVRAVDFTNDSPPEDRFKGGYDQKLDATRRYNGQRIIFCSRGIVNGQEVFTDLAYYTETDGGGTRKIQMDFETKSTMAGEIWVDEDREMVRHAYLKVEDARYTGKIPKISTHTLMNAEARAGISFLMQYDCILVPQNTNHLTP